MINGKTVLGSIPARGGSKGIPCKNLLGVAGKPLLIWAIEQGQASDHIDRLIVSSDDAAIISTAQKCNCNVPFVRPQHLATDVARSIDVVKHAMDQMENSYEYIVVLQPTSPLRTPADIDGALALCDAHRAPSCVTVSEAEKSPYWMYKIEDTGRLAPLLPLQDRPSRRQDISKEYALNGAVYVARWTWIRERDSFVSEQTMAYIMPRERAVDIDAPLDVAIAEALFTMRGERCFREKVAPSGGKTCGQ